MTWHYKEPMACDYDTDEEYEKALASYEDAQMAYEDEVIEKRHCK